MIFLTLWSISYLAEVALVSYLAPCSCFLFVPPRVPYFCGFLPAVIYRIYAAGAESSDSGRSMAQLLRPQARAEHEVDEEPKLAAAAVRRSDPVGAVEIPRRLCDGAPREPL